MTASPGLAYENDILGNRTWQNQFVSTNGMRMEWDVLNRMTSACKVAGGARYEYRADGMRIKKVEGLTLEWQEYPPEEKMEEGSGYYDAIVTRDNDTTRYRYDGQMLFEDEYTHAGDHTAVVDVTRNGLGARGIDYIAKTTSSGTTVAFPIYDGHGNMVATLGRNGTTAYTLGDQRHFDAWGKIRSGSATGDPKGRYVANLGHVQDDESGLVYMRARYYEPTTGRFVSEDPGRQGINWFVYCGNSPTLGSDYSGKFWHILLGALLGGLAGLVNGLVAGYSGWKLTGTIVVGIIAGALSAATGAGVAGLLTNSAGNLTAGGIMAGGASGGALGNLINSAYDEATSGRAVNWGRIGRAIGIGGATGLCFGVIGAAAQRNGEIAAAMSGLNGDLWGMAADSYMEN